MAEEKEKEKEEGIVLDGIVLETQRGKFTVEIIKEGEVSNDNDKMLVQAHLAGKMRKHYIRIVVGDMVKVEVSPYDLTRGRIIYRSK